MLILAFASSDGIVRIIPLICAMYVGIACLFSLVFLSAVGWKTPEKIINSELHSCTRTTAMSSTEGQKRS